MGCASLGELESKLILKSWRGTPMKSVLDALDRTLQQEGLDMATQSSLANAG